MNAAFTLQIEQSLRNLGFTRHEVQCLVYLVRVKKSTAQQLSRENTIPYNMAKAVLSNLVRRGLVTIENAEEEQYVFCGKAAFTKWLEAEKNKHQAIYAEAAQDMEQFLSASEASQWQPEVLFYEGVEGIREIYEDMFASGEDLYTCTDLRQPMDVLGADYVNDMVGEFKKNGMKIYSIRSADVDEVLSSELNMPPGELLEVKTVKDLELNGEIKIYGNKSALITFDGGKPVGFVFDGGPTAELMRSFFKTLWNSV